MLEILQYPDPRLKVKAQPVVSFGPDLHQLLDDMAVAMYAARGIGLAATQVGKPVRAFVIDLGLQKNYPQKLYEFINPVLKDGDGKILFEEGCLSVPGITEEVSRKARITVSYQDRHGEPQSLTTDGLLAVAIQHENDHLDGVLFIDRLGLLQRRMAKKKLAEGVAL